jgi:hypothetical protein
VTRSGERSGRRARPHHPRVPEPFIDALAVQALASATPQVGAAPVAGPAKWEPVRRRKHPRHSLARLLGVGLKLLLQRRKLGER